MSNGNHRPPTAVVYAAAAMFCTTLLCATVVSVFVETDTGVLVAQLLGALAIGLPAVIGVAKMYEVASKQDRAVEGVDKLRNGEMDSKLRAAVAEILQPHLIDPAAKPQLEIDRAVRDAEAREVHENGGP